MVKRSISDEEVLHHMNTVKDAKEYRRWQIIRLVKIQKIKITNAAKVAGVSRLTVYETLNRFDRFGPEGMPTKPRGGRLDSYMSLEEEKSLIEGLLEPGEKGLILTAKAVKKAAEQKLQKSVSIYYAYDLLHRHGWRKIIPRPKHPKSDKEKQAEFKKKFHYWSKNV